MPKSSKLVIGAALCAVLATTTVAYARVSRVQKDVATQRLAHMNLQAFQLGVLAQMMQGRQPYDPELAVAAADALASLAQQDWTTYLLPGTSSGEIETSRAAASIWTNMDDFLARKQGLADATDQMLAAAGDGLEALTAQMGAVTEACGQCHRDYRVIPAN
ncbi:cytochrome c [Poseidonocella sp. HB161398]|uniref:c-type cytochrome n=1 Tax=Poseidonocella sp. HB161398 TaxID=2320855 RepID=UPI001486A279|nr:cytochrome c [Poseidonocella sp. HB161398]